jgi:tripartite-type tricarboxylate transporter receptor subunit TctC
MQNRDGWYFLVPVLFLLAFSSALEAAEKFPTQAIQVITSNPPGGVVDMTVRIMAGTLQKNLGVPIVVNNRGGGGGVSGTYSLVKSKPDGYTIGSMSSKEVVILPATIPNVPFTYSDLDPLCKYASNPTLVFCKADAPWKTLEELVADAKTRPGQITYGATSNSVSHLLMEGFLKDAGISMLHIPLNAAGQTLTRVLGGNLDIGVIAPSPLVGQLKAGTVRPLFITTEERLRNFPQIPTLKEKGFRKPLLTLYMGFFAPLGVPKAIRGTLEKALVKTIKDPTVEKKLEDVELNVEYLPGPAFAKEIEESYKRLVQIVKAPAIQK